MYTKVAIEDLNIYAACEEFSACAHDKTELKDGFIALSFNTFLKLDLQKEIEGTTNFLAGLCLFSKEKDCTVFCGVNTSIAHLNTVSAAVCHKGALLDILDRTTDASGEITVDPKIKIFSLNGVRAALLIDTDAYDEKNWERVVPHCDAVLAIIDGGFIPKEILLASKKFEKPFVGVCNTSVMWHDGKIE